MTPAPNDLSLTFNLPTLSAAEPKKKKPEAASEPPQKVSAPSEAPVKDPQPRVEESPTVKKPETQQIPPSSPLPTDDDSASKVKGKSPNEKYNLSIDQDLIPRIRWAVQKETGYVYKQGYIYLVAVEEVPLKDIERYLDAYNRNLSTVPELPKVTVRLGNRHAVPAAPSLPPKKVADVDALAKKLGISRSRYFATALRIWLDQHDMMPPAKEHLAENLQQYISSMGLYVPPADLQRLAKKARVSEDSASKNS